MAENIEKKYQYGVIPTSNLTLDKVVGLYAYYNNIDLIYYAIHYSDNIAYKMLMDRFSRENIHKFWSSLGTSYIFSSNNRRWLVSHRLYYPN